MINYCRRCCKTHWAELESLVWITVSAGHSLPKRHSSNLCLNFFHHAVFKIEISPFFWHAAHERQDFSLLTVVTWFMHFWANCNLFVLLSLQAAATRITYAHSHTYLQKALLILCKNWKYFNMFPKFLKICFIRVLPKDIAKKWKQ